MIAYSKAELEAAHKAISSSIRKIEKAQETLAKKEPPPKAQLTLAARNLDALRLSLSLITREMDHAEEYESRVGVNQVVQSGSYQGIQGFSAMSKQACKKTQPQ